MSSPELLRVYASEKNKNATGDYNLTGPSSERDLDALGDDLREGLRVMFDVQFEFEVEGVLVRNAKSESWLGRPDISTRRKLEESAD